MVTPGCGGSVSAFLFNVTVLHYRTELLCFDPTLHRPLYFQSITEDEISSASIVAFQEHVSDSDFVVPTYCSSACSHNAKKSGIPHRKVFLNLAR